MCSLIDFLQWKKIQKDFNDFWHRKLTLNVKFWQVWHLSITLICKIQWFHLTKVDFEPKTILILYPSLENSTTPIAIVYIKYFLGLAIFATYSARSCSIRLIEFYTSTTEDENIWRGHWGVIWRRIFCSWDNSTLWPLNTLTPWPPAPLAL